jgi:hypothetical protein
MPNILIGVDIVLHIVFMCEPVSKSLKNALMDLDSRIVEAKPSLRGIANSKGILQIFISLCCFDLCKVPCFSLFQTCDSVFRLKAVANIVL